MWCSCRSRIDRLCEVRLYIVQQVLGILRYQNHEYREVLMGIGS